MSPTSRSSKSAIAETSSTCFISPSAGSSADLPPAVSHTHFPTRDYDLAATLDSGQAFRWTAHHTSWDSVIGSHRVRLQPTTHGIQAWAWPATPDWNWLAHYLQLHVNLDLVLASFPAHDPHLSAAVIACRGLRLLRQDPWECLASFILSSTKQIVQIRQIVELLCRRYGKLLPPAPGIPPAWSFPRPETIAALTETDLRDCKMGFRAPALLSAARRLADRTLVLDDLARLPTADARQRLIELPGVGEKIANCVLLFACGAQDAFPIDVWVLKALRELYFPGRRPSRSELNAFALSHFGPHAGYAQQYLFHYMRIHLNPRIRQTPANA
jgi:N-glycosylase/DNA lyase